MYAFVPHHSKHHVSLWPNQVCKFFNVPDGCSTSTLLGLMSRWMIFREWRYEIPRNNIVAASDVNEIVFAVDFIVQSACHEIKYQKRLLVFLYELNHTDEILMVQAVEHIHLFFRIIGRICMARLFVNVP